MDNILANKVRWYQNGDNRTGYKKGVDQNMMVITPGGTYLFSVGFKL